MTWEPPIIGTRHVGIIGAGIHGRQIACTFVAGGYDVKIFDQCIQARNEASQYIDENKLKYASFIRHRPRPSASQLGTYEMSKHYTKIVHKAWLVIEAIPEQLDLKMHCFGDLDLCTVGDCIMATSSSLFKSSQLLENVSLPRRKLICNMHYNMLPEIRTVELMTNGETHKDVLSFLSDVLRVCGMVPVIVKKESTGFIFNRLWQAVNREALTMLAEGVSDPAQIDAVWSSTLKTDVAPCRMMDRAGLDTVALIEEAYAQERGLDVTRTVDFLVEQYISKDKLGEKSENGGLYPPS